MAARVSMLLKSRASPDMLPFGLCNKKRLAIWHMNDTIDSVLRHREVRRAKDFSAPPLIEFTSETVSQVRISIVGIK